MKKISLENLTIQKIKENSGQPIRKVLKENNMDLSKDKSITPSTPTKDENKYKNNSISKHVSFFNFNEESDEFKNDYEKAIEGIEKEDHKVSEKTESKESIKTESMNNYSQNDAEMIIPQKKQNEIIFLEKQGKKGNRNNRPMDCLYLEKKLLEKITQRNLDFLYKKKYYRKDKLFKILEINGLDSKIDEIDNILEQQKCKYKIYKYKKYYKDIISGENIINKNFNNSSDMNLELNLTKVNMPSDNEILGNTEIGQIVNTGSNN